MKVFREKLPVGDYTLPLDHSICIDTKKDLLELSSNVCQQHARFIKELEYAKELGSQLIILCEHSSKIKCLEDVKEWKNPRLQYNPKALDGEKLHKILATIEKRHGCRFEFCSKKETGQRIIELLTENRGGDVAD